MSAPSALSSERKSRWLIALSLCMFALGYIPPIDAQLRRVEDTFTAETAGISPAGVALRLQVLAWSDDSARADVVSALEGPDLATLAKLPTVGYIWPTDSPVGYSVKYAYRTDAAGGGERITLVTDKPLGSYDYRKWSVSGAAAKTEPGYSVIELTLDAAGNGTGTSSLVADVVVDPATSTVSLASGGAAVLTQVRRQPDARGRRRRACLYPGGRFTPRRVAMRSAWA